jgi:hypothetical protein
MVVIIHERLKRNEELLRALTFLDGHAIKYTSQPQPFDILVNTPGCSAIALAIMDGHEELQCVQMRLNALQRIFKHSFAVGNVGDEEDWAVLQNGISGCEQNSVMTMKVKYKMVPIALNAIVKDMTATKKFELQTAFFDQGRKMNHSSSTARRISVSTFEKLGIRNEDAAMMMDCLGNMSRLITSDSNVILNSVPVDSNVVDGLQSFFGAKL